jgi:hypothetical protein
MARREACWRKRIRRATRSASFAAKGASLFHLALYVQLWDTLACPVRTGVGQAVTTLQDNGTATVPLAEAAARLGISEELVRKRIYRGKLAGEKIDGRWHVVLNHQDSPQEGCQDQSGLVQDSEDRFAAELIAHQQDEIGFLRQELTARAEEMTRQREQWAEESRRKDVIIHELSSQLKALPAKIVEQQQAATSEPEPATTPIRPWWKFWAMD